MSLAGTIVNGSIQLDGNPPLPEGVRVWVDFEDDRDDLIPPATETYVQHLAILRQSITDAQAGKRGLPLEEAFARIATECNLSPLSEN